MNRTIKEFWAPKEKQDGEKSTQETAGQASNLQQDKGEQPTDKTPLSSLEIDGLPETSSSDDEDCEDDFQSSERKRQPKFNSMNLSKFLTKKKEKGERAELIIETFMMKTGKRFKRSQKRKYQSPDPGHRSKKRRSDTDPKPGHTSQQSLASNDDQQPSTSHERQMGDGQQTEGQDEESEINQEGSRLSATDGEDCPSESGRGQQSEEGQVRQQSEEGQVRPDDRDDDDDMPDPESESESAIPETIRREAKVLNLQDTVEEDIKRHPSGFDVKLYVLTNPSEPEMYTTVKGMIQPEQLKACTNISSSFILFFYRTVDDCPDIFVMYSGQAYIQLKDRCCPTFSKKIAKRLLQFKTIELETRNVAGDTSQIRKLFLPNMGGSINIWDLIDVFVHKYKAYPKDDSSVYNLGCFKTDKGKKKKISFSIKPLSVVVNHSTTISDMQEMIAHFSKIDLGKTTELYESEQTEEDDKEFEKMEFIQEEHSTKVKQQLDRNLQNRIKRFLKTSKETEDISLSVENLEEWLKAEKFYLFLKRKQQPIETWEGKPPMLSDVIKAVKRHITRKTKRKQEERITNLDRLAKNVQLATGKGSAVGKRRPLIKYLVGAFITSESNPYFLWHGKWLKIKMEYQSIVADSFKNIIEDNTAKPEEVLPLPWATSSSKHDQAEKLHTTNAFLPKTLVDFLKSVNADGQYTDESLKKLLSELGHVTPREEKIVSQYDPNAYQIYDKKDKMLAMVFLRLHSSLDEGMYNATYIWLDQILSMMSPTHQLGYIVGDKMLSFNIEMFDILMYDEEHTYLVHAKEGFNHHVRDVSSQIRNSADLLMRALTSQSSHSILQEMWETFSKEEDRPCNAKKQKSPAFSSRSKKDLGKGNKKLDELFKKDDKLSSTSMEKSPIMTSLRAENTKSMKRYKETIRSKVNGIGEEKFKELFTGRREIVYVLASRYTRKDGNILPAEDDSSILTALQKAYAGQSLTILELLTNQGYVTNQMCTLTDKFIMSIKKKQDFVSSMMKPTPSSKSRTSRHEDSGYPETVGESEMTKTQTKASPQAFDTTEEDETNFDTESQHSNNEGLSDENIASDSELTDDSTKHKRYERQESSSEEETPKEADNRKFSDKTWEDVYDILRKSLPNTKSTIAQLEILSLFSHFRNYQIGPKKFQLKICFLSLSNDDLGKNLKAFLNREI